MLKGCLFLLAILAASCLLEKRELDRRGLPEPWLAAGALGLAATLTVGTVQGLLQARRLQAQPQTPREQWRAEQLVRVGGTIRSTGPAPKTPFTHREAVFFEYEASAPESINAPSNNHGLVWKGMDMAQPALDTANGRILLTGFPSLKHFPLRNLPSRDCLPQAAHKLATTEWKFLPDILNASLSEAERDFANATGEMPVNRINRAAAECLDMQAGKGSDQHFLDRLAQRNWNFRERLVAPGEEVTVVGTYHENPPRLDIALSVWNHQHALYQGGAAKSAAGEQRTAIIFLVVLGLITLAMHYLVYNADGALYRRLIEEMKG